jgi:hypothetical protein
MINKLKQFNNYKQHKKTQKTKQQKGGAIYSFDFNNKIGGLPAWIPLNSTKDGDCPDSNIKDLGFTNYGITNGGSRRHSSNHRNSNSRNHRNSNKLINKSKTKKHHT